MFSAMLHSCYDFPVVSWGLTEIGLYSAENGFSSSQMCGLVVRALDFYPVKPGSNPTVDWNCIWYASFLCYDFPVVRAPKMYNRLQNCVGPVV